MADFIKQTVLRNYISASEKIRISKTALKNLTKQIDSITRALIKEAKKLAKQDKRTTIMPRDIAEAKEQLTGKKLGWQEIAQAITRLGPIDLGNISKAIGGYVKKEKQKPLK